MAIWKEELYHYGVKGMRWRNRKEFDKVVNDTIRGNYGNGADRQKRLGDDYYQVQSEVNRRLLGRESTPKDYLGKGFKNGASASSANSQRVNELRKASKVTSRKTSSTISEKKNKKVSSYDKGKAFAQMLFGKKKKR